MKSLRWTTCVLLGVLLCTAVNAQKNWMKEANQAYSSQTYYSAIGLYKKAFPKVKSAADKAECVYQIAECHRHLANPKQAVVWYEKAIKARHPDPKVWFYKGEMLKELGSYQDAVNAFARYQELEPNVEAAQAIATCQMASEWIEKPEKYVVQPEYLLNSREFDFSPTYAKGRGDVLVFSSSRDESTGPAIDIITGESFQDLFISSRDKKGKWSVPKPLGPNVNTDANEGAACLNRKSNLLFFTRCQMEKNRNLGCDIWVSKKKGNDWGESRALGFRPEGNDSVTFGHPTLSADELVMVFVSDMEGGQGGKDLWYSTYDKKSDTWSKPVNCGPTINTAKDELFPRLRNNGDLYFASNGHPGMGGLDIFIATANGNTDWRNPQNLKYPINSNAHDFGIVFDEEMERGYFTSNRAGGRGQDDIYSFRKLEPVFSLVCQVKDQETLEPLVNTQVQVVGADNEIYNLMTDSNGEARFELMDDGATRYIKGESSYRIRVEKEDYLASEDGITTVGLDESTIFIKEFMVPGTVAPIKMPLVQYPYDDCSLLVNSGINSEDSLAYLLQVMQQNPNIVVELMAHTDARGSSSYNRKLSQCRAQVCVEYLISRGISPERLVAKGYGEDQPVISEKQIKKMDETAAAAAHQTNRRTEFRVLRSDYQKENSPDAGNSDQ